MDMKISNELPLSGTKNESQNHIEFSRHFQAVGTVTIPKEVFEELYPRKPQPESARFLLRKTFGNAFPL